MRSNPFNTPTHTALEKNQGREEKIYFRNMARHFLNKVRWHKKKNLSKILYISLLITAFSFVSVIHWGLFFPEQKRKRSSVLLDAHTEVLRSMMEWPLGSLWLNPPRAGFQSKAEKGEVVVQAETRAGVLRSRWRRESKGRGSPWGNAPSSKRPPGGKAGDHCSSQDTSSAQSDMMTSLIRVVLRSGHQSQ